MCHVLRKPQTSVKVSIFGCGKVKGRAVSLSSAVRGLWDLHRAGRRRRTSLVSRFPVSRVQDVTGGTRAATPPFPAVTDELYRAGVQAVPEAAVSRAAGPQSCWRVLKSERLKVAVSCLSVSSLFWTWLVNTSTFVLRKFQDSICSL